jgi:hypothetical protein
VEKLFAEPKGDEMVGAEHKTDYGGTCTHIEHVLKIISRTIASSPKYFSQVTRATLLTPAKMND